MGKKENLVISLRRMQESDLPQVLEIEDKCFYVPWHNYGFLSAMESDSTCYLVAESQKKVVGYMGFSYALDEGDLCKIAVHPDMQRQGIGKEMLEQGIMTLKGLGVTHIFLEVRVSNEGAIALYRQIGFQEIGIREHYYTQPPEDALVMEWKV
ncbi:MAG: ribosomal protein S18-alanine N-acetyltransferase [Lachnospiraceae bacterium]|nr:ribosomal protein S18-alanine N-acetyltransferase [Lachnospiraceae bacterium]